MEIKFLKRNILQRLFGIPATKKPRDNSCWTYSDSKLVIDLKSTPELSEPGGAIRLEGHGLPDRILVIRGNDGAYHAFSNRCKHMGRRLDPVPGDRTVQCCSVGKATYAYDGSVLFGPAKEAVKTLAVEISNGKLVVALGGGGTASRD
jgi:nitrite reductase/ring-hydroxylating ferredoxin subunit